MQIQFFKYQGTGNDFVLIDNRDKSVELSASQIAWLCDRRFGIGADGLMLLEPEDGYDFRMVYYNSDGNESTMCGNGGRCIVAFARQLGLIQQEANFVAIDGPHKAVIGTDDAVSLHMIDVPAIESFSNHTVLNTGSPHFVTWVAQVSDLDVYSEGKSIRNRQEYQPKGINVNFAERLGGVIKVRTYERGVEAETLSCGTGVTAVAIASAGSATGKFVVAIETPGGNLTVSFEKDNPHSATHVVLMGPARFVFEGSVEV